jgi:hypothetical protein
MAQEEPKIRMAQSGGGVVVEKAIAILMENGMTEKQAQKTIYEMTMSGILLAMPRGFGS